MRTTAQITIELGDESADVMGVMGELIFKHTNALGMSLTHAGFYTRIYGFRKSFLRDDPPLRKIGKLTMLCDFRG